MFDKFGEFDSVEEINLAAAGFLNEGDMDSLRELAAENGIDPEDVQDYMDKFTEELANAYSAALGRLTVEEREMDKMKPAEKAPLQLILTMTRGLCTEPEMAAAVMKKGKRVSAIYKAMREEASRHKSGNMAVSCGTDRDLQKIIKAYYMGTGLKKALSALYEGR